MKSFYEVLTEAINDLAENGYDSEIRLEGWMQKLRQAAEQDMPSAKEMQKRIDLSLRAIYRRNVENGAALRYHPGIDRFTLDRIAPDLRMDLDRRILASANLIRLNRDQAIEKTLQRFSGWSTSIPVTGTRAVRRQEVKASIGKSLSQARYEVRRLEIDQGHKLISSINAIIGEQSGAIAMQWHSHWRQAGYQYRADHKERDQKFYAIRNSWAQKEGLINKGAGYTDEMTAPAQEVFCRCWGSWYNQLQDLPESMLTKKGITLLRGKHASP